MYVPVIKDKLDHLEEKFAIIIKVFLSKKGLDQDQAGSGFDLATKFPIRQDPDPQHCDRPLIKPKQNT